MCRVSRAVVCLAYGIAVLACGFSTHPLTPRDAGQGMRAIKRVCLCVDHVFAAMQTVVPVEVYCMSEVGASPAMSACTFRTLLHANDVTAMLACYPSTTSPALYIYGDIVGCRTYLVRFSQKTKMYVLSFRDCSPQSGPKIRHYQINKTDANTFQVCLLCTPGIGAVCCWCVCVSRLLLWHRIHLSLPAQLSLS